MITKLNKDTIWLCEDLGFIWPLVYSTCRPSGGVRRLEGPWQHSLTLKVPDGAQATVNLETKHERWIQLVCENECLYSSLYSF